MTGSDKEIAADLGVPRPSSPMHQVSWHGFSSKAPINSVATDSGSPILITNKKPYQKRSLLFSCEAESDDWRTTRRVVHKSLQFKLAIQRMQRTPIRTMPCIFDPLDLSQFVELDRDPEDSSNREESGIEGRDKPRYLASMESLSVDGCCDSREETRQQLPPIVTDPTECDGDAICPSILDAAQLSQLQSALPRRFQEAAFHRCYCLARDGDRLETLLYKSRHVSHTIIVIETTAGDILGGFCAEPWSVRQQYHGNGQSFLFASRPDGAVTATDGKLRIYPWTGHNDYCQVCDDYLAMGGQGSFGWRVCSELVRGQTGWCRTYGNPPLVRGGFFDVLNLEVYAVVNGLG